ncbi:MAG: transcriptional regulator, partial [Flavobacteriales bacterium]
MASRIANERRKRELEPILRIMENFSEIEDPDANKQELKEFKGQMKDLKKFTSKVDKVFNAMAKSDERWFSGILMKLIK